MDSKGYEELERLSDRDLFDYVTEKDSSQRKWAAMHLLELRRNRALVSAARSSAFAAWVATLVAGVAACVAVLAYLSK
jgi:hypothetical protein